MVQSFVHKFLANFLLGYITQQLKHLQHDLHITTVKIAVGVTLNFNLDYTY